MAKQTKDDFYLKTIGVKTDSGLRFVRIYGSEETPLEPKRLTLMDVDGITLLSSFCGFTSPPGDEFPGKNLIHNNQTAVLAGYKISVWLNELNGNGSAKVLTTLPGKSRIGHKTMIGHVFSYQYTPPQYTSNQFVFAQIDPTVPIFIGSQGYGKARSIQIRGGKPRTDPFMNTVRVPNTRISVEVDVDGQIWKDLFSLLELYTAQEFSRLFPGGTLSADARTKFIDFIKKLSDDHLALSRS